MTADGLEVLLEGLIPEIAYSGERGESNPSRSLPPCHGLSRILAQGEVITYDFHVTSMF